MEFGNKNEILICNCHNVEHQLVLVYDEEDGCREVYCYVHLGKLPFWERLKNGIKYIFGYKSKYGDFDEFIFNPKDADKLQEAVNYLRETDKTSILNKLLDDIEHDDNTLEGVKATESISISPYELNCIIEAFRNIYICYPHIKERKTCLHRLIMRAWHMAACIAKKEKYGYGIYSNADLVPSVEPTTTLWSRSEILNEVSSILADYLYIDANEEVIELLNERLKKGV